MLGKLFTALSVLYLLCLGKIIFQMWVPPGCRDNRPCYQPMYSQHELASADLYFFVTDDPDLGEWDDSLGRPPEHIAVEAAGVLTKAKAKAEARRKAADGSGEESCGMGHGGDFNDDSSSSIPSDYDGSNRDGSDVGGGCGGGDDGGGDDGGDDGGEAGAGGGGAELDEAGGRLRLAAVERGIDLATGVASPALALSSVLRVPLLPSTRGNRTLFGLFFLCPGGRPLDPAAYPVDLPAVERGELVGGGRRRTFDESVLFATAPLTNHARARRSASEAFLLDRPALAAPSERGGDNGGGGGGGGGGWKAAPELAEPEDAAVNHWRYSYHPLRLRLAAPLAAIGEAWLAPDGLRLRLHRANDRFLPRVGDEGGRGRRDAGGGDRGGGKRGSEATKRRGEAPVVVVHRPFWYVDDWTVLGRQTVPLSSDPARPDPAARLEVKAATLGRMRTFTLVATSLATLTGTGLVSGGDVDEIKRCEGAHTPGSIPSSIIVIPPFPSNPSLAGVRHWGQQVCVCACLTIPSCRNPPPPLPPAAAAT